MRPFIPQPCLLNVRFLTAEKIFLYCKYMCILHGPVFVRLTLSHSYYSARAILHVVLIIKFVIKKILLLSAVFKLFDENHPIASKYIIKMLMYVSPIHYQLQMFSMNQEPLKT